MMPENERDDGDDEFYPWDCDNSAPSEADVADLLDDSED